MIHIPAKVCNGLRNGNLILRLSWILLLTAVCAVCLLGTVRSRLSHKTIGIRLLGRLTGGTDGMAYGMRALPPSGSLPPTNIVDAYGQYTGASWPGKLSGDSDLVTRRTSEAALLSVPPVASGVDGYGGWAQGPHLAASGFFRTINNGGKWWLVDPIGNLFFSVGIDSVRIDDATVVSGREQMFTWLPATTDALANHYGTVPPVTGSTVSGKTYDFYQANLDRKYGSDYQNAFQSVALNRLQTWGFNTLGNSLQWSLFKNGRIPYTERVNVTGDYNRVSSGSTWAPPMDDPFDPGFAGAVANSMRPLVAQVKGDPWFIGYFVDNELGWSGKGGYSSDIPRNRYGLAYGTMNQDIAQSPAKQAFVAQLRAKYRHVSGLNAAWGTQFTNWQSMNAPYQGSDTPSSDCQNDLAAFCLSFAEQYFRTIRSELLKQDTNHLYLGCRFSTDADPPEAVTAAAEFADVISFNIYQPAIDATTSAMFSRLGKPCMVGEFHSGALDRGMFSPGLVDAGSQAGRAAMYQQYIQSALNDPSLVGCHWFKYVDEPITGRASDGENYNLGFIDITDTPYPELVEAAKAINFKIYSRGTTP